ncbi:hypothetical protein IMG5_154090 [Ichthyophthirius multifiliis]|uniref:Phosphoglycerate mutase n=1 Tax=Ichthyophthirius multifiliis TaxID=5932 RepID=G0QZ35_ICHMU|nr:hypothetical protein IMG5_154090 [Ichthyophthirius multifiliis]EGR29521.1 hypothetical protein IMG5_154090 [Ichthyophthirius multifiliis]|eukprot:XP_004030757.1 hypothetical protein IMG5_154090 [Ichthyophthirius multifiliis]
MSDYNLNSFCSDHENEQQEENIKDYLNDPKNPPDHRLRISIDIRSLKDQDFRGNIYNLLQAQVKKTSQSYARVYDVYLPVDELDEERNPIKKIAELRVILYLEDLGPKDQLNQKEKELGLDENEEYNNLEQQQQPLVLNDKNSDFVGDLEYKIIWELENWKKAEEQKFKIYLKQKEVDFLQKLNEEYKRKEIEKDKVFKKTECSINLLHKKIKEKANDLQKREQKIVLLEEELKTKIQDVSRQVSIKEDLIVDLKKKLKDEKGNSEKEKTVLKAQYIILLIIFICVSIFYSPSIFYVLISINSRFCFSTQEAKYKIVLMRHGESIWNQENRFTGWKDVQLSAKGIQEARSAGKTLKQNGYEFDIVFTSVLQRAIQTYNNVADELECHHLPVIKHWRLNERHYGSLQGLNKSETAQLHGEDQVKIWRRSYSIPPPPMTENDERFPGKDKRYAQVPAHALPKTEALADCVVRVIPFWYDAIVPQVLSGKKVMVVAHGNSLRSIVKHLDNVSEKDITEINIPTSVPLVYEFDEEFKPIRHFYLEIRSSFQLRKKK